MIAIRTFGFKHEDPRDTSAYVLDCRCLPNPHNVAQLKALTGRDKAVQDYLKYVDDFQVLLGRGFLYADCIDGTEDTLWVGCYGGRHRSVAVAEVLATALRDIGREVFVSHPNIPPLPD